MKSIFDSIKNMFNLFSVFFYVAIFTVGGGVAMVAVVERILVEKKKLISDKEFAEIFSIAQILPGSLMINMATFAGYKIAGFWGALFSCIAISIPPLVIITVIAIFYEKFVEIALVRNIMLGILAGVVGQVAGITLKMVKKTKFDTFKMVLFVCAFVLIFLFHVNPIYVVIIGALVGVLFGKRE